MHDWDIQPQSGLGHQSAEHPSIRLMRMELVVQHLTRWAESKTRSVTHIRDVQTSQAARLDGHQQRITDHDRQLAELQETKRTVDDVRRSVTFLMGTRNVVVGLIAMWLVATGRLHPDKLVELLLKSSGGN